MSAVLGVDDTNACRKFIGNPETVAPPLKKYYANSVRVTSGPLVFVSGQVAIDADGALVGPGDMRAQAVQVLENIKNILEHHGSSMADVLKVTVFVTDIAAFHLIEDIRNAYFEENPPASTIVEISQLAKPEWLIEIEAVATASST